MQILLRIIGFTIILPVKISQSHGLWPAPADGGAGIPAGAAALCALRYLESAAHFRYRSGVTEIYRFQWVLSLQLLAWSVLCLLAGTVILTATFDPPAGPLLQGIAIQALIWGGVDGVLAIWGLLRSRSGARMAPDEYRSIRETRRMRRILRVNARLDVLYVLIGLALAFVFRDRPAVAGHGIGVVIQGFFLMLFDALQARRLPANAPAWYDPAV